MSCRKSVNTSVCLFGFVTGYYRPHIRSFQYLCMYMIYFFLQAFDSAEDNVSNEKWVLYFNSDHECSRFKTALSASWLSQYQVWNDLFNSLLILSYIRQLKSRRLWKYLIKNILNFYKWKFNNWIELKTLWQREKLLIFISNHNVFKSCLLLMP